MSSQGFETIDAYIAACPDAVRPALNQMRAVIRAAAPDATEIINYQMPTFFLNGNLVHFAAYKSHIGFYPAPDAITVFRQELLPYKTSKGAIRFPLGLPLPIDLISRIVQFRVNANMKLTRKGNS